MVTVTVPAGMQIAALSHGPEAYHTLLALAPLPTPALANLTISPQKTSAKRPLTPTLTYTLNTPASVTFTLTRTLPGRKLKNHCVKPTHKNRKKPHCKRTTSIGTPLTHLSATGNNNLTLTEDKLAPGAYTLTATPTGGAPQQTTLTVTK